MPNNAVRRFTLQIINDVFIHRNLNSNRKYLNADVQYSLKSRPILGLFKSKDSKTFNLLVIYENCEEIILCFIDFDKTCHFAYDPRMHMSLVKPTKQELSSILPLSYYTDWLLPIR